MEANDEKLNGILQFAKRLAEEGHYAADKIQKKAENIAERRENNRSVGGGETVGVSEMVIG